MFIFSFLERYEHRGLLTMFIPFRKLTNHPQFLLFSLFSTVFVLGYLAVFFGVSAIKSEEEQDQSKKVLFQVYKTLYRYKAENGVFPDTSGKPIQISQLKELKPYFKTPEQFREMEKTEILIKSRANQFNLEVQKVLPNGGHDIQDLNSKKEFCHKLNGLKHESQDCTVS